MEGRIRLWLVSGRFLPFFGGASRAAFGAWPMPRDGAGEYFVLLLLLWDGETEAPVDLLISVDLNRTGGSKALLGSIISPREGAPV